MAKKTSKSGSKQPEAPPGALKKVQKAVVGAAETVAAAVGDAAASAQKHVVRPVAEAVGLVKAKKSKPVRAKPKATPKPAAPLPSRSKSVAGRMMSKNVPPSPKAVEQSETTRKPKP